jgi:hypothetical protein
MKATASLIKRIFKRQTPRVYPRVLQFCIQGSNPVIIIDVWAPFSGKMQVKSAWDHTLEAEGKLQPDVAVWYYLSIHFL